MAILTAGGIYKNKESHLTGGHLISALAARHTYEDVYLHTNFSSEETDLTAALKDSLRNAGVSNRSAQSVSAPYGIIGDEGFTVNSNVDETYNQKEKYLNAIDTMILTNDSQERYFSNILNSAGRTGLHILVFTCGEYLPRSVDDKNLVMLENTGFPNYHAHINEIKETLASRGIISSTPAKNRDIPETAAQQSGRTVIQLLLIAAGLVMLFTGGFKLL